VAESFERERIDEYERVIFGYETLIENVCDPQLSYLDFKPELKTALTANAELRAALTSAADYMDLWTVETVADPPAGSLEALAVQVCGLLPRCPATQDVLDR
jgi:hypothetical protein